MASPVYSMTWPVPPLTPMRPMMPRMMSLAGHARGNFAVYADFHGAGLELAKGLGCQHVFHLGSADADGESAEGAVGGGVAVAADDGLAGLGVAQVGADYVDDALQWAEAVVEGNAELFAVAGEGVKLGAGDFVGHRKGQVPGGSVVVGGGNSQVGAADSASGHSQPVEGLG